MAALTQRVASCSGADQKSSAELFVCTVSKLPTATLTGLLVPASSSEMTSCRVRRWDSMHETYAWPCICRFHSEVRTMTLSRATARPRGGSEAHDAA